MTKIHQIDDLYFCGKLTSDRLHEMKGQQHIMPERIALVFCEGGTLRFFVGESQIRLDTSNFLLLRPRQEITLESFDEGVVLYIIGFMPAIQDVVAKQFSLGFFTTIMKQPLWTLDERTQRALRSFYDLYDYNYRHVTGSFSTEIANSLFTVFMQSFYQQISEKIADEGAFPSGTLNVRTLSGKFLQLLNENFKNEHSVAFYSDQLCVSSKYLAQVVKSVSTFTPKELIDRRLGQEALFLLTKTDMNIQEISNQLGFPDQSYFGRFFKRLFGMAPLYYRLNPDMSVMEKLSAKS